MAYSRWSTSTWYTYWNVGSGRRKREQIFTICGVDSFTYYFLTHHRKAALSIVEALYCCCEEELEELSVYMDRFVMDVDREFKWYKKLPPTSWLWKLHRHFFVIKPLRRDLKKLKQQGEKTMETERIEEDEIRGVKMALSKVSLMDEIEAYGGSYRETLRQRHRKIIDASADYFQIDRQSTINEVICDLADAVGEQYGAEIIDEIKEVLTDKVEELCTDLANLRKYRANARTAYCSLQIAYERLKRLVAKRIL